MSKVLDALSWLVTVQPIATLLVLLLVTVTLGAGFTRMAPLAPSDVFLPEDSALATASGKIETIFGDPKPAITATMLFRGSPLTPEGLALIDRAVGEVEAHALVAPLLVGPVVSPTRPLAAALGTSDFASLSQEEVDAVAAGNPALARLVGFDDDGTQVAAAHARLRADVPEDQL